MTLENYTESSLRVNLQAPRPVSENFEMSETDFEDDSEIEDYSLDVIIKPSQNRRSETTISSFDEVHTPNSICNKFYGFNPDISLAKPVEGPQGPHLFRSSVSSTVQAEYSAGDRLGFKETQITSASLSSSKSMIKEAIPRPKIHSPGSFDETQDHLNLAEIPWWTPRHVSRWLFDAGFEASISEKFEANHISGIILTALKFEDLKELGILSFNQRVKVWDEIQFLQESASSMIQLDKTLVSLNLESQKQLRRPLDLELSHALNKEPGGRKNPDGRLQRFENSTLKSLEPVSIIGIEQLIPKPRWCPKGRNCSRWRKRQRLLEILNRENSPGFEQAWSWIGGDLKGKTTTCDVVAGYSICDSKRFESASLDSVDAAYQSLRKAQLKEDSLRNLESLDPRESVGRFTHLQNVGGQILGRSIDQVATAKFVREQSAQRPKITGVRETRSLTTSTHTSKPQTTNQSGYLRHDMGRAAAPPSELANPSTFSSGVDVSLGAGSNGSVVGKKSPLDPLNMSSNVHVPAYASMRGSPDFSAMNETQPTTKKKNNNAKELSADDVTHAGWMMKRRTRLLRHEWHQRHFTLQGTQLVMRKDERSLETLEYIDIDDYAIACSSLASSSKMTFKAMLVSRSKNNQINEHDAAAFAFQLIPVTVLKKGTHLRQTFGAAALAALVSGRPSIGCIFCMKNKTHHFAARSRDERIDWMRELMLAKALSQKSKGYEIMVNGNLI